MSVWSDVYFGWRALGRLTPAVDRRGFTTSIGAQFSPRISANAIA